MSTLKNWYGYDSESIDRLEAPLFECGFGYFTQGYGSFVGVSAPKYLEDDFLFEHEVLSDHQITK
tara:strand:- start:786 stop:980 length:195 start_codon:yes stop_codon:yes gene_type:complete